MSGGTKGCLGPKDYKGTTDKKGGVSGKKKKTKKKTKVFDFNFKTNQPGTKKPRISGLYGKKKFPMQRKCEGKKYVLDVKGGAGGKERKNGLKHS